MGFIPDLILFPIFSYSEMWSITLQILKMNITILKWSSISQNGWFNNIWILFVMLSFQSIERLLVFDWLVYFLLTSGGGGWNKTLEFPPRCEVCVRQQPWCWVSQGGIYGRINYHKTKESLNSCFIIIISCKPLQSSFHVQFWLIDNGEWLVYKNINII